MFEPIPAAESKRELTPAELAVIRQMVLQAKDAGVALTGLDGLRKSLTKAVIMTEGMGTFEPHPSRAT